MNKKAQSARGWRNPRVIRSTAAGKLAESLGYGSRLRRKAAAGWALGTFLIELPTPATLASLSLAGFDYVVLDMEHSAVDFSTLEPLILAAHSAGLAALVRTWGEDTGLIGKVLDLGANGIMVPHVENAQRARAVAEESRFPPRGSRGFSPLTKFDALSHPLQALDESVFVVVQVEGRAGLEQAGRIAAVPGIDAVFVGPYDLALSLGVSPGSPRVVTAAERLAKAVPDTVCLGIYIDDPKQCAAWAARRFALQCVSFDGRMLSDGARRIADEAKRGIKKRRGRRT